jgi:hypothetical protein
VLTLAALPNGRAAAQGVDLRSPLTSSLATSPERPATACPAPRVELAPVRGGQTHIAVDTACRAQQMVIFTYAGAVFIQTLDASGRVALVLDCFAGDREAVTIRFEDQTTVVRQPIVGEDMSDLSKVAIVWTSTVDLDLHAFEYSATFGGPGHVWSGQPRSLQEASAGARREGRGQGFMSTAGAGGEVGMNLEVYTFMHQRGQAPGFIKLAVDYASRGTRPEGRFCGSGDLAEMRFKAYILERGAPVRKLDLAFSAVPCGVEINPGARFNVRVIPDLLIRR